MEHAMVAMAGGPLSPLVAADAPSPSRCCVPAAPSTSVLWEPTSSFCSLQCGRGHRICAGNMRATAIPMREDAQCEESKGAHVLQDYERPLSTSETHMLPMALSLEDAMTALKSFICNLHPPPFRSGILRFQVPLPPEIKALHWLQCQPQCTHLLPRIYFSPRSAPHSGSNLTREGSLTEVAGVGSAVLFRGSEPFSVEHWKSINRFLSENSPLIRAYGAMRFNPDIEPSVEWEAFGTFYFFIPQVELCEMGSYSLLAANLTWGDVEFEKAVETLLMALNSVSIQITSSFEGLHFSGLHKTHSPDETSWQAGVDRVLKALDTSRDDDITRDASPRLTKVVMARQTKLEMDGNVHPFTLLASLQEQNPSAYQFCLQLPDGSAFIGNTPEQLFARNGLLVTSEAVAATRPRGVTSVDDYWIALDLLQSSKDHTEFQIVQDSVKSAMERVCKHVKTVMQKGIIKQPKVQHLCTQFVGELNDEYGEYDLLAALHPTPAVCGHPCGSAKNAITCTEAFDRGMYAGPVGWFGGQGAEFAVGIRSSLIQSCNPSAINSTREIRQESTAIDHLNGFPRLHSSETEQRARQGTRMFLYAGVGIVKGSNSSSEWHELELKISQFEALLQPSRELKDAANVNMLWANLIVEECCRLGVTYFCIAPGSRSSPLAEAAAANSRVSCISCLDERSLAFYALGYGRGARRPAAVVITSGTAVSNLLPAVVEASQDCVPLLVLSADRPHELRDTGSNQTIDQVNHFGTFLRYHFDLPPATDEVPARMVLTTLDTAVFRATTDPYGPVHINCPFREPLEAVGVRWDFKCLEGMSEWVASSSPFTTYISTTTSLLGCTILHTSSQMRMVANLVANAERGLIVVGGLNQVQTTWAVFKLAEHLKWPLVPDVLSGLRLTSRGTRDVHIIYNFDHVLLNRSLHPSVTPDVILQIGSRITSKRLAQFLQECSPRAHILVEEHPYRHDPAHRITHRIKCPVTEFTGIVFQELTSSLLEKPYGFWLHLLSETAGREILFQLHAESTLTEPCIAQIVSASVSPESALFLGNSMPIRDVDMYADGFLVRGDDQHLPVMIKSAANRGASGIDGVISTAVGFAAGSKKRVTLLLGDLSFLHDTNGLMLLAGREAQPPVTVVVVNNRGGAIFSLLPVANLMPHVPFTTLLSSVHDVQLRKLCHAHRLNHVFVQSKNELVRALECTRSSQSNWVVEVGSNIKDNTNFHRYLQTEICSHMNRAFPILLLQKDTGMMIREVDYFAYRFPLASPVTTGFDKNPPPELYREGFILRITLLNGSLGIGEIAPLQGLHDEDLLDVEEQLRLFRQKLRGVELVQTLALLDGSFSEWLSTRLGILPETIFPSVRCGLEMAALQALAASNGCSLWELFNGFPMGTEACTENNKTATIQVCGLIDSQGSPEAVTLAAEQLVTTGFSTLKIKVARQASPLQDAAVLVAVRKKVGRDIRLRADANRRWTLSQALEFSNAVQECDLQYLEEPLQNLSDLPKFLRQTDIRVALDETLDGNGGNYVEVLQKLASSNLVAAVIKPARVGGFENANRLARLSQKQKMNAVISASFESSISLAVYAQFAAFVDRKNMPVLGNTAHGLGTYKWIKRDIVDASFSKFLDRGSTSTAEAAMISRGLHLNSNVVKSAVRHTQTLTATANCSSYRYTFRIIETSAGQGDSACMPTLVFLHGLLGKAEDWLPIMDSLINSFRCLAIDLPGHGQTSVTKISETQEEWCIESLGEAISELLKQISKRKVVLVGYSMGARIALYMALHKLEQIEAAVSISGSPGIKDVHARLKRAMQDDDLAESLRLGGLKSFVTTWYKKPVWKSLRCHADFEAIQEARTMHDNVDALADAVRRLSIGRQPCMWQLVEKISVPLLVLVGKLDNKFVKIAREMVLQGEQSTQAKGIKLKLLEVEGSGHAVHIENPLPVIRALRVFAVESST